MSDNKLLYRIGLTQIKGVGRTLGRHLVNIVGDEEGVFREKNQLLRKISGIGSQIIHEIKNPEVLKRAEKEVEFVKKNKIQTFFFTEPDYPFRLKECIDAPILLYYKGNADLNVSKTISMVGTRNASSYGKDFCDKFISDAGNKYPDALIISGLAYGIDIQSHRAALSNGLKTVAVLAHGLDRIYPYEHRKTAAEITVQGGLLTEYPSETQPDKFNFVTRNSIIAGLGDATIVVESATKGGSLITAEVANAYDRDVFAVPGRISDTSFKGCLNLIKSNKACLLESLADMEECLGWNQKINGKKIAVQQHLEFLDLTDEQNAIITALSNDEIHVNRLAVKTDIPVHRLSFILLELEFKNLIKPLPGGLYKRK
ncbi:MAG: DNA-processing protein DprA [Candidatus Azobacteroides sp.]|nr:DNA-processing protein DprA [Candidatus Azobacteroides sp.]